MNNQNSISSALICPISGLKFRTSKSILRESFKHNYKELQHPDLASWNKKITINDINKVSNEDECHLLIILLLQEYEVIKRVTSPLTKHNKPKSLLKDLFFLLRQKEHLDKPTVNVNRDLNLQEYCKDLRNLYGSFGKTRTWSEVCDDTLEYINVYSVDSPRGSVQMAKFFSTFVERSKADKVSKKVLIDIAEQLRTHKYFRIKTVQIEAILKLVIAYKNDNKDCPEFALLGFLETYLLYVISRIRSLDALPNEVLKLSLFDVPTSTLGNEVDSLEYSEEELELLREGE